VCKEYIASIRGKHSEEEKMFLRYNIVFCFLLKIEKIQCSYCSEEMLKKNDNTHIKRKHRHFKSEEEIEPSKKAKTSNY